MRRRILPALGMALALPALALVANARMPDLLSAVAEPPELLEGCSDVPEAVALAEELRDRALRIERYMASIETQKAELAQAETTLRERLAELRTQKGAITAGRQGDTQAVRTDIDKLIAVYDQMKPAEAAAILTNLPADFAAEILMRVRPEAGARIIAAVEPRQAALLTAQMGARSVRNP
ncbi:hypothetical protein Q4511_14875 [Paracoccus sp. 1_MG-2023]|uniref:MotE family protein n=1 Tax=unclassified Paracoccus (in: a-proteobacteria) TaxID=2688777 RepID=UPI001C0A3869|nr:MULTISPECIES: hypothetical protein [unclassified Paracoccus (in: a-proteobacteria)]MBU2956823.1 hypothetical protein [Paracoccus sp. C2R09]MDO6670208.1 hypothetical protein [Paracoccus sp. 1_MG-2023]